MVKCIVWELNEDHKTMLTASIELSRVPALGEFIQLGKTDYVVTEVLHHAASPEYADAQLGVMLVVPQLITSPCVGQFVRRKKLPITG